MKKEESLAREKNTFDKKKKTGLYQILPSHPSSELNCQAGSDNYA
jgi:hypothetical protein